MPRITRVAHARQRYEMIPVIDEETGEQKTVTTTRATRARGRRPSRPVVQRLTEPDLSRPLPPHTCDYCREPIEVGQAYMWIAPKSGPYGGRKRFRHQSHPAWHPWEYSSSLSAQLARVSHEFQLAIDSAGSEDDVQSALDEAASQIEEIADAKAESAESIESGFGHATSQSEELADIADQLRSWAQEIQGAAIPDFPEPEETGCETCDGTGKATHNLMADAPDCADCGGTGQVTPDEPDEDQIDGWRDEVRSDLSIVDEPPI